MSIKLSQGTISAIIKSVTNNSGVELSDKELFLLAYNEYKVVPKAQRGHVTNLLNVQVRLVTKSDNIANTLKKVFKLAQNYVEMQVICKFDKLEYTNINNLVKLFKYVDNNVADKAKELREDIKSIHTDDMSIHRYNNAISAAIVELKEEYKLKDTEDGFVFKDMYALVQNSVSKMTQEQLHQMLKLIERNLLTVGEYLDNTGTTTPAAA